MVKKQTPSDSWGWEGHQSFRIPGLSKFHTGPTPPTGPHSDSYLTIGSTESTFYLTHSTLLADNFKISISYQDISCQSPSSTYWIFFGLFNCHLKAKLIIFPPSKCTPLLNKNKHHQKTWLLPKAKFLNTGSSVKFIYPPLQHLASPQALSNFSMEGFTYLCCVSILATIAPVLDHMTWITATCCLLISLSPSPLFCNQLFLFSSDTFPLGSTFLMLFSSSKILNDSLFLAVFNLSCQVGEVVSLFYYQWQK